MSLRKCAHLSSTSMWHSRAAAGGRASDVTVTLPELDPWILRHTPQAINTILYKPPSHDGPRTQSSPRHAASAISSWTRDVVLAKRFHYEEPPGGMHLQWSASSQVVSSRRKGHYEEKRCEDRWMKRLSARRAVVTAGPVRTTEGLDKA